MGVECGSHVLLSSQLSKTRSKWVLTAGPGGPITHHQLSFNYSQDLRAYLNGQVNPLHSPKRELESQTNAFNKQDMRNIAGSEVLV